ncbi:hypothetical protein PPN31114_03864 [Pandoraea pneumonica]|uniref:Uncharacterized protein n=1 Tax=Pandoraea pneumonica TaxID=2508299 RepID=A0A5E4XF92_9BURK|nr:hypothetical protein PPN31114_03864 [Pandoraea pneumonica]
MRESVEVQRESAFHAVQTRYTPATGSRNDVMTQRNGSLSPRVFGQLEVVRVQVIDA